ncbi:hypothetical protein [Lachnospira multipara]|uniref:hypothetical protein n=1 Tax=Lachnospira multipara TaxID=28051 RepID=UPI0012DC8FCC|nr:hypothetical protein [Lachnospira multipara]
MNLGNQASNLEAQEMNMGNPASNIEVQKMNLSNPASNLISEADYNPVSSLETNYISV